jgi:2-dehydropantoate 2-reductase
MRIAIVGAGALGSIYAFRLGHVAQIDFVVRDLARAPARILAEMANGSTPAHWIEAPKARLDVPSDADAVLLCVRADQVTDRVIDVLAGEGPPHRIVLTLTPLLPSLHRRVRARIGSRLVVGMTGVVAYEPVRGHVEHPNKGEREGDRHVRYWTPRTSPTTLDARPEGDPHAPTVHALAEALKATFLPTEIRPHVDTMNPATTIAFLPLLLGLHAAGTIDALLSNGPLLKLTLDAAKESRAVAKKIGELAPFAGIILSFAGPFTVRAGIKLARSRAPEAMTFLEQHFGTKLRAQQMAMLAEVEALAHEKGIAIPSIGKLAALVR